MTEINAEQFETLGNKVVVIDLDFGEKKTKAGLILMDDDGKLGGIKCRWAKVFKVGKDHTDLKVGQYVLLEHGRWSRAIDITNADEKKKMYLIDYPNAVVMVTDKQPLELSEII